MKKSQSLFMMFIIVLIAGGLYSCSARGASYDIKEDIVLPALPKNAVVSVKAEKVMDGVTDLNVYTQVGKNKERFILQCDANQQTMSVYYFMKDTLGGKAKGADAWGITLYEGTDTHYVEGGRGFIYNSEIIGSNFREKLSKIANSGINGYMVFEFYQTMADGSRSTIAQSNPIKFSVAKDMLKAVDAIPNSEGCNLEGGFTTVQPLVRYGDSF